MTESIFVPFELTTQEACANAAAVLLDEPSPRVVSSATFHLMTRDEALEFFRKRKAERDDNHQI